MSARTEALERLVEIERLVREHTRTGCARLAEAGGQPLTDEHLDGLVAYLSQRVRLAVHRGAVEWAAGRLAEAEGDPDDGWPPIGAYRSRR